MSALFLSVKSNRLSARKSKNSVLVSVLTTLMGELETQAKKIGKEVSDEMVVATCKKFIANNKETMKVATGENSLVLVIENAALGIYLPQQLTETELREIVAELNPSNIGVAMGHLKKNYNGQYDGRLASQIVKELV